jgi:hypothetical protein
VFLYLFIIVELNDVQGLCFLYFLILFYHSLGISLEESFSLSLSLSLSLSCTCACVFVCVCVAVIMLTFYGHHGLLAILSLF